MSRYLLSWRDPGYFIYRSDCFFFDIQSSYSIPKYQKNGIPQTGLSPKLVGHPVPSSNISPVGVWKAVGIMHKNHKEELKISILDTWSPWGVCLSQYTTMCSLRWLKAKVLWVPWSLDNTEFGCTDDLTKYTFEAMYHFLFHVEFSSDLLWKMGFHLNKIHEAPGISILLDICLSCRVSLYPTQTNPWINTWIPPLFRSWSKTDHYTNCGMHMVAYVALRVDYIKETFFRIKLDEKMIE